MTVVVPKRPVLRISRNKNYHNHFKQTTHIYEQLVLCIEHLQESFNETHRDVGSNLLPRREKVHATHNKAKNIIEPKFDTGDSVLGRRAMDRGHKIITKWYVTCRMVAIHGCMVCSVESLREDRV